MSTRDGPCHRPGALPEELLLKIFHRATDSPMRHFESLAELPPFETLRAAFDDARTKQALQTKLSLSHASSFTRRLVISFLYEEVRIHRDAEALLQSLQASNGHDGYGKYVRRIVLPHSNHSIEPEVLRKIIECCPEVRILTRPSASRKDKHYQPLHIEDMKLNSDALKQLTRIDWNNASSDDADVFSFSPSFIWSCRSLRVLTLGSRNFHDFFADASGLQGVPSTDIMQTEIRIDLPNIHTLRLRTLDALGDPFSHWYSASFPSLRRIVLEAPAGLYPLYEGCLTFYGSKIETIEFSAHVGFLRIDAVALALFYCPNVRELCFPVFNTTPVRKNPPDVSDAERRFYKVERVVLHAFVETDAGYQVSKSWMTTHLADHIDSFCAEGTRFTSLKTVVLFGSEWRQLVEDTSIMRLLENVTQKGIKIKHVEW